MHVLTINGGSSSLKAAFYDLEGSSRPSRALTAERIGQPVGRLRILDAAGATLLDRREVIRTHEHALRMFLDWLQQHDFATAPTAIGHRIVHGGSKHRAPVILTPEVLADLRQLAAIDPNHLPQALAVIQVTTELYPGVPEIACFDTAFHSSMPPVAQAYGLPRSLSEDGIIRYGFHGLSCEYIMGALQATDRSAATGRIVIAHLGSGASLTAVRAGASVDTTMGFSPTGGLVMGTRSGDLDPSVLLNLLGPKKMSQPDVDRLVNQESGLLGVSGLSADMRDLLDKESADPRAAEAINLFCYVARKFLGGLVVVLGGLDSLVFTAGIGEHAAPIRERICRGLGFLGLELDPERNERHAPIISREDSRVVVRVIATDEDRVIVEHVRRLIST